MIISTPQPLKIRLKIRRGTFLYWKMCERMIALGWMFSYTYWVTANYVILAKINLKWALWAIKQQQCPSFVLRPFDPTNDDTIEHCSTHNFQWWSPKRLLLPQWNVGMRKSREFPVLGNITLSTIDMEWIYFPLQRLYR